MVQYLVGILLFPDYETIDAHAPIEFLCSPPTKGAFRLITVAEKSGIVRSKQGIGVIAEHSFEDCPQLDVLLVPGGPGVRKEVSNQRLLKWMTDIYSSSTHPLKFLLSVCTGSWLLARAGLLDGRKATSNKAAWEATVQQSDKTIWLHTARWVEDDNVITSSGVSAGMDMSLYFIAKVLGEEVAAQAAKFAEYSGQWKNPSDDPFGVLLPDE